MKSDFVLKKHLFPFYLKSHIFPELPSIFLKIVFWASVSKHLHLFSGFPLLFRLYWTCLEIFFYIPFRYFLIFPLFSSIQWKFSLHPRKMLGLLEFSLKCSWITGITCITYQEHCSTNSKRLTFTLLSSDSWKYANCNITNNCKKVFLWAKKPPKSFPQNLILIFSILK